MGIRRRSVAEEEEIESVVTGEEREQAQPRRHCCTEGITLTNLCEVERDFIFFGKGTGAGAGAEKGCSECVFSFLSPSPVLLHSLSSHHSPFLYRSPPQILVFLPTLLFTTSFIVFTSHTYTHTYTVITNTLSSPHSFLVLQTSCSSTPGEEEEMERE